MYEFCLRLPAIPRIVIGLLTVLPFSIASFSASACELAVDNMRGVGGEGFMNCRPRFIVSILVVDNLPSLYLCKLIDIGNYISVR